MKILALIDIAPGASNQVVRAELADELKGSWKLYVSGVLREAYATATATRVAFVLEAESVLEAERHLQQLPLIAGHLMTFELIELRPFANWSLLFPPDAEEATRR